MADKISKLLKADDKLVDEYMSVDDGYFDGFGLSEHIGFNFWNDEDNRYPASIYVNPVKQNRMVVARCEHEDYLTGGYWSEMKPSYWNDAMRPDVDEIRFEIAVEGTGNVNYEIHTDCEWLSFSSIKGCVEKKDILKAYIDRTRFSGEAEGLFTVEIDNETKDKAKVIVKAYNPTETDVKNAFWENDGYVSVMAEHYARKHDLDNGSFETLSPYGRAGSAIGVSPVTADFEGKADAPYVEYDIAVNEAADYNVLFYLAPTTPVVFESKQYLGYGANGEPMKVVNTVHDPGKPFFLSKQWENEAISNVKLVQSEINLKKGLNTIRFYGISPQIILEKFVVYKKGMELPKSCLGPKESYYHR